MKIAFIYPNSIEHVFPQYREDFDTKVWCGLDDFIMKYPKAVMDLGVEPVLFYFSRNGKGSKEYLHKYGFPIKRIPVTFGAGCLEREISLSLLRQIRKERFDLLHYYSYYRNRRYPDMFDIFAFCSRILGHPFVIHYQAGKFPATSSRNSFKKFLMKPKRVIKTLAMRSAERIISLNELEIERLSNRNHPEYYGIPFRREKLVYVPNIVDRSLFFPIEKEEACRLLDMDSKKKYILYVGFLREAKGIHDLVNIMPELRRNQSNIELVVVGNGEYEENLRNLVKRMGIEDKVYFVGPVPNNRLCPYYNVADVHVLPSYTEGLPSVVLEALACNVPSVGTIVGGIPDILSDGVGLLVRPGRENELHVAIRKVLDGDFKINQEKRATKLQEYSYETAGKILFDTYQEILKQKRQSGNFLTA